MNILAQKFNPSNLGLPTAVEIGETVRLWEPDPSQFKLASLFPMKLISAQELSWNELEAILGMTKGYRPDGDVQSIKQRGRTPRTATPFYFREAGELFESDFINAMSEMAYNRLACEELVMNLTAQLDLRCETRIEWVRAQAIALGSVTVEGETVTYNVPSANRPTAGTYWTDLANSDPVANILAWLMLFRGVGGQVRCLYSRAVANLLCQNAKVKALYTGSGMVGQLGPENVGQLLAMQVDGSQNVSFEIYDGGYLDEDTGLYSPFLPDNRFLMVAAPPKNQPLGHFMSTPSISNADENSFTPRAGKFVVVDNKLKSKKPHYEQTQGIYGGVAWYHIKNVVSAKIAA